jgi:hypothetical protein
MDIKALRASDICESAILYQFIPDEFGTNYSIH